MGKEDYVVICGDFGGVWDVDRFKVQESPEEKNALDWLESKPFTTLFIPGNHENYDRLIGCSNERLMEILSKASESGSSDITQYSFGSGDNVGRDKIVHS